MTTIDTTAITYNRETRDAEVLCFCRDCYQAFQAAKREPFCPSCRATRHASMQVAIYGPTVVHARMAEPTPELVEVAPTTQHTCPACGLSYETGSRTTNSGCPRCQSYTDHDSLCSHCHAPEPVEVQADEAYIADRSEGPYVIALNLGLDTPSYVVCGPDETLDAWLTSELADAKMWPMRADASAWLANYRLNATIEPLYQLDLDNQPAGQCFPDEPLGDCVLDGKPAWSLDEALQSPLCPDHKEQERTWMTNRDANPGGSGGGGGRIADQAYLNALDGTGPWPGDGYHAAGSVWAPGPPPPPPAPPTTAPAHASALLPLIRLLLDVWAEEPRPTPYDRELAALARALEPPPPFSICTACGSAYHQAWRCPEVVAERLRQEQQARLGLSIHITYIERRQVLAEVLRDGDAAQRAGMAEALMLYLSDATGVALPVEMVTSHFDKLAA